MIENLKVLLQTKYNYELNSKVLYKLTGKKTKFVRFFLFLFVVILALYVLGTLEIIDQYIDFFILLFAFFSLVMIPLGLRSNEKDTILIITPRFIIQALGKTEFIIVEFDEITKYAFDEKQGLAVFEKRKKVVVPFALYQERLEILIDILEAKGKTFDNTRDFMVRPIEIVIEDGEISIKDIEVLTSTDMIFEKYLSDYKMLTPGFVNEVIFLNSVVEESAKGENFIIFKLGKITVSKGHPENTTFDQVEAEDCIVIFEGPEINHVKYKDMSDSESEVIQLPADIRSFLGKIDKGIISDSEVKGRTFNVDFATGLEMYMVSFTFKDVIVGWNKMNTKNTQ